MLRRYFDEKINKYKKSKIEQFRKSDFVIFCSSTASLPPGRAPSLSLDPPTKKQKNYKKNTKQLQTTTKQLQQTIKAQQKLLTWNDPHAPKIQQYKKYFE